MIKIYYVPSHKITREYRLINQGLVNNSRVELVDNEKDSDFVFFFYSAIEGNPQFKKAFPPEKTVVIDYHDSPRRGIPVNHLAYFKRSWVVRMTEENYTTKKSIPRPSNYYPLTMAIMDEFIIRENIERDIVLSCTLRRSRRWHHNRQRVLELLEGMDIQGKKQIGEFNKGTMFRFNAPDMREYFKLLRRSRIVVTCNPGKWEGDHRTWEAFANGALVFVDKMYTPLSHPLIDGEHCIFYDLSDSGLKILRERILYYLDRTDKAERIAQAGYEFTMKYHRASNRIDEILERITAYKTGGIEMEVK